MKFLQHCLLSPTHAFCTVLVIFTIGCNDLPTRFIAPVIDLGLTAPLLDSLITIDQMVQDSALLRKDGRGNLILVQGAPLPVTMIGDSLRLPSMSVNYTSTAREQTQILDKISFGNTASIPLRALYPTLPPPPGKAVINGVKLFSRLANVGDAKSLVIHPASTTHSRMSTDALARAGITEGTIRLSIGLEDPKDLVDDLVRALKAAEKAK